MSPESAVVTEGLTKRFGNLVAVDHIDLVVEAGELYGFLGPNGSGKTTTLRMLCGILEPSEGRGRVLGFDLRREPEQIKAAIGYMSQRFSLYDDLTAEENVTFYATVYGVPGRERRRRVQQMVQLADLVGRVDVLAGRLSGGYRQRLALACALVHAPRLVFLDEQTAGVDPVSRRTFWELIRRLADGGVTIVVTTHYMDEAEHCDRLGFIYQGKLIAQGTPASIKTETFRKPVFQITTPDPRRAADVLAAWPAAEEVVRYGPLVRLVAAREDVVADAIRAQLAAAGLPGTVEAVLPSVEDLFVSFVDRERKSRLREQLRAVSAESEPAAPHR
ncbi:MAG: ABC transporter ATP-binding protein [Candidatus Rokubacteria bacterium]|nr:ABC transporter ATP-binding protein [Candidatus Rokubacteria bacterium]